MIAELILGAIAGALIALHAFEVKELSNAITSVITIMGMIATRLIDKDD